MKDVSRNGQTDRQREGFYEGNVCFLRLSNAPKNIICQYWKWSEDKYEIKKMYYIWTFLNSETENIYLASVYRAQFFWHPRRC
jgi:hypothetical protein